MPFLRCSTWNSIRYSSWCHASTEQNRAIPFLTIWQSLMCVGLMCQLALWVDGATKMNVIIIIHWRNTLCYLKPMIWCFSGCKKYKPPAFLWPSSTAQIWLHQHSMALSSNIHNELKIWSQHYQYYILLGLFLHFGENRFYRVAISHKGNITPTGKANIFQKKCFPKRIRFCCISSLKALESFWESREGWSTIWARVSIKKKK